MKHNRRGFLRMLLAAPVAAAVAAGLYKPPALRYVRYHGKLAITGDAMKALQGEKNAVWSKVSQGQARDSFQATLRTYHQMMVVPRARITDVEV
ncbi:MAG: twin-arginine translocation signal domain-containing protein [Gemmatimonadetes bacterium]|nr:twin-arginine translocation signal domain-containing protein [Gemmatimonadota bacterium]